MLGVFAAASAELFTRDLEDFLGAENLKPPFGAGNTFSYYSSWWLSFNPFGDGHTKPSTGFFGNPYNIIMGI